MINNRLLFLMPWYWYKFNEKICPIRINYAVNE